MAYSNQTEALVGSVSKNNRGDSIKVKRVTSGTGAQSIDIRTYYTDDNDEEQPTKKGIRLSSELLPEVMKLVIKSMAIEERMDLLEMLDKELNSSEKEESKEDAPAEDK